MSRSFVMSSTLLLLTLTILIAKKPSINMDQKEKIYVLENLLQSIFEKKFTSKTVKNATELDARTVQLISNGFIVPRWSFQKEETSGTFGENGKGAKIDKKRLKKDVYAFMKGWNKNHFNRYVSDLISLHRSLPDVRDDECKSIVYRQQLSQVSVIIIFHNEALSVLLRTVHSVMDRSPPSLMKEIILIDDFSDQENLKEELADYVKVLEKVQVMRNKKRKGLINSRLLGVSAATASVFIFLDSHCECTMGWLEPLLAMIAINKSIVALPIIDMINENDFSYHRTFANATPVGGFNWHMEFNLHPIPLREIKRRRSPIEAIRSPTIAGGMFAISKSFFDRIGRFDSNMGVWPADNLELSFKTWMCGGSVMQVLCSHVGSLLKLQKPDYDEMNPLKRASLRIAEVWMDDYKKYVYENIGKFKKKDKDISSRKKLREELKCKSFQWYLDNIFPELFIPANAKASGQIHTIHRVKNMTDSYKNICLTGSILKADPLLCIASREQFWMLSSVGEIRKEDDRCLDYKDDLVVVYPCVPRKASQKWIYNEKKHTIRSMNTSQCLTLSDNFLYLKLEVCLDKENQMWYWKKDDWLKRYLKQFIGKIRSLNSFNRSIINNVEMGNQSLGLEFV